MDKAVQSKAIHTKAKNETFSSNSNTMAKHILSHNEHLLNKCAEERWRNGGQWLVVAADIF